MTVRKRAAPGNSRQEQQPVSGESRRVESTEVLTGVEKDLCHGQLVADKCERRLSCGSHLSVGHWTQLLRY